MDAPNGSSEPDEADEADQADLETLIAGHRRRRRLADARAAARPFGGPLDPTMQELVADQFAGEPLFVTLRLDLKRGADVRMRVHNDRDLLARLSAQGWVECPDESHGSPARWTGH